MPVSPIAELIIQQDTVVLAVFLGGSKMKVKVTECPICDGSGYMMMDRIDVAPDRCKYCLDGKIHELVGEKKDD